MEYDEDDPLKEAKLYDDFIDGKIQMTPYYELEKRGCAPPYLEDIETDEDVNRELTNLIWNLADLSIYISSTDHLSDRELYAKLLDFCDQPNMFFPGNKRTCCGWSPIDSGSDEDEELYLRYYANYKTRKQWERDFKVTLPKKEKRPYPRPWIPVWDPYAGLEP